MKISVIVPVFNVEDYLHECIESVIQQTYREFELILIDDGSTDRSGLICDQYGKQYLQYVKILHIQNSGSLRARIQGINNASGDVLVFLDADDCLRKDALEYIALCFKENTCDMVMYNAGPCEEFSTLRLTHTFEDRKVFEGILKKEVYRLLILGHIPNSVCLKAVRATCISLPNNLEQYNVKHGEDLLLSAYLIANCEKIVYLKEDLYHYRNRQGSAVHSFNNQRQESLKIVHTELAKCIKEWNMSELELIHNGRKVKGWIYNLLLLMKYRTQLSKDEFRIQLHNMAEDSYFRDAYLTMDIAQLSKMYHLLAYCLFRQQYFLLELFYIGMCVVRKLKFWRNYDR